MNQNKSVPNADPCRTPELIFRHPDIDHLKQLYVHDLEDSFWLVKVIQAQRRITLI